MKILTWNIKGLNGRSKQRILQNYIKMEDPDIFLIQETKCARKTVEDIIKICWRNCESYQTDSKGASGGLPILWNPATVILDQGFSTPCTSHSRVTHRQGSRSRWFHNRVLPLLLANVKGGSVVAGGGIPQLKQSSSSTKCHFPHPNTQRRKSHKSK